MKKIYTLLAVLLSVSLVFGQTYLEEDFSSGDMPPANWTIDNMASQWSSAGTSKAGGSAPEAKISWKQTNGLSRLISPVVDLSGTSGVMINFVHFMDDYGGGDYSIGCSVRAGGGDWENIWEVSPNSNIGPEIKFIEIPDEYQGVSDFEFCLFLDGNWYNFDFWYLDNIKVITPANFDLELSSINIPSFTEVNVPFDVTGKVVNVGNATINSFDVTYTVDGGSPSVSSFSGLDLLLGDTYNFTCDDELSFVISGSYLIDVTISNINGGDDDIIENNTLSSSIGVLPYLIDKKVLGEEATGTWCGWCVRGVCYMDYMAETYPDQWIGVAVHSGDPMEIPEYADALSTIIPNFPGYPSGTVNRTEAYDPSEFENAFLQNLEILTPATCEITNYSWDESTREVIFDVESEFIIEIFGELRFMAIIVEDSVWGRGSGWSQSNAYAGGNNGPMCGFEDLPSSIADVDMHYDHVARAVLDSPYGTEGSLPGELLTGQTYSHTYTYTIPESWDFHKLHFVGVVLDVPSGAILNASSITGDIVGTIEHDMSGTVKVFPNPTNGLLTISEVEDATVMVYNSKGILVETYNSFNGGTINLSGFASGIYLLKINTDQGIVVKRVVLN